MICDLSNHMQSIQRSDGFGPFHYLTTVGIWIPTNWILETFEYQTLWSPDFKWFSIQMISLCGMFCVLDQPFEYQTCTYENKMASVCLVFKCHSNTRSFSIQALWPFKYQTSWYSDPHCSLLFKSSQYNNSHSQVKRELQFYNVNA